MIMPDDLFTSEWFSIVVGAVCCFGAGNQVAIDDVFRVSAACAAWDGVSTAVDVSCIGPPSSTVSCGRPGMM